MLLLAGGSAPFDRCHCDCLASSAPFTNIQTYLLTNLLPVSEHVKVKIAGYVTELSSSACDGGPDAATGSCSTSCVMDGKHQL